MSDEKMVSVPESVLRKWATDTEHHDTEVMRREMRSYLPRERPEPWMVEFRHGAIELHESDLYGGAAYIQLRNIIHIDPELNLPDKCGLARSDVEELCAKCHEILGDGEPVECHAYSQNDRESIPYSLSPIQAGGDTPIYVPDAWVSEARARLNGED